MYDLSSDPSINSAHALGVKIEADARIVQRHQQIIDEQNAFFQRTVEGIAARNPMIDQLQELLDNAREQNELLMHQVQLMQQENERQKAQLATAEAAEIEAKKAAKCSRIFGWVSFGVATAISIAALIVSIIAIL